MQKEMDNNGVRRGAWTKEEDIVLRNCIEKYGEGNWHKVPPRAGLNRCRKSCRLRWLNYLRPNLKRGYFNKDEVDLIRRLHKLLGNRWSLIAGRLPGRTANDVKNFWNTHMVKKSAAVGESCKGKTTPKNINENNIIKPRPRTFSKLQAPICPSEITKTSEPNNENIDNNNEPFSTVSPLQHPVNNDENPNKKQQPCSSSQEEPNDWTNSVENPVNKPFQLSQEEVDECIQWWSNLLEITENGEGMPLLFSNEDDPITQPIFSSALSGHENNVQTNQDGLSSSSIDVNVWELMNVDDQ